MTSSTPPAAADAVGAIRAEIGRRVHSETLELPLLPQVASRVLDLAREESSHAAELSSLIQQDQALAGHVMRVANSSMYQTRMPMVSLQQAIARLGMTMITEIALSASIGGKVFRVPGHEAAVAAMWRHALGSGAWAKELARTLRRNVESAYLCGLLHRIGRPIVLQETVEVARRLGVPVPAEELPQVLDEFQVEVGGLLAQRWSLPQAVTAAIAHWSHYERAPEFLEHAAMTFCASRLASGMQDGDGAPPTSIHGHDVLATLNLYPDDVESLLQRTGAIRELVEAMSL